MVTKSINAWLSMKNSLQARLAELKEMKGNASTRHISRYDGKEDIVEPTYDIKQIDKKCALITTALFNIDQAIKEANAATKIEIDVDYNELVKPLE
jgi:K+-sensing histidine kinase KdpD